MINSKRNWLVRKKHDSQRVDSSGMFKCVICRQGETQPGVTTVTLERNGLTLVVKQVPARVCADCGEEYVDEATSAQLLATAE